MTAASKAAITNPTRPVGSKFRMSVGYAKSGFFTCSGKSAKAMMPGRTSMKTGSILRKHALHNHLIRAPIPDAKNRRAKKYACPWKILVAGRSHHVEVTRRHHGAQVFKSTHAVEANDRQSHRATYKDEGLDGIGVDDRGQAAGDCVNAGGDHQNNRRLPQRPASDTLQNDASRVKLNRNLRENVCDDRNRRQIHSAVAIEAALQKFRHGEYVRTQVKRHEHPSENQQYQAGKPLKMPYREPRGSAGSGQSNKVLGRNVRNEQ